MRKIILCLLLALLGLSANAQWETVYYPNTNDTLPYLNAVAFHDFNNGFAVGKVILNGIGQGIILKTINNGTNWDTVFTSTDTIELKAVTFTDATTLFAVGDSPNGMRGSINKTTDLGVTWTSTITNIGLLSVSFPSINIGYACGYSGAILKTNDAGVTWNSLNSGIFGYMTSIYFVNDTIGFACEQDTIIKTIDGGITWSNQGFVFSGFGFNKIFFPTDSIGYCKTIGSGTNTQIYKTNDQGNTWSLQGTIVNILGSESMFFTDKNTGYLVGQFYMEKTIDGGTTWIEQYSTPPSIINSFYDNLMDVFMLNKDTGFAVGYGQFYRTSIGGTTEIESITSTNNSISIYPNPNKGTFTLSYHLSTPNNELQITDILGRTVYTCNIAQTEGTQTIDISTLSNGVYFYQLTNEKETLRGKFLVEK